MLDFPAVNVAIGLMLVYFLASVICSHVNEFIAKLARLRATMLEKSVIAMLGDAGVANDVMRHPIISALASKKKKGTAGPSYIPSRAFALALLDQIAPSDPNAPPMLFADVRAKIALLPYLDLRRSLLALFDAAAGDLATSRENVEKWFDDAMDRATGWYKHEIKRILLLVAFAVTIGVNLDSVSIATAMWKSVELQKQMVGQAPVLAKELREEVTVDSTGVMPALHVRRDTLIDMPHATAQLNATGLPIGWSVPGACPSTFGDWVIKLFGWFITAAFVSLGAPFWFDMLNSFINVRASGARPEKAK
jgi:hypothetical protein